MLLLQDKEILKNVIKIGDHRACFHNADKYGYLGVV